MNLLLSSVSRFLLVIMVASALISSASSTAEVLSLAGAEQNWEGWVVTGAGWHEESGGPASTSSPQSYWRSGELEEGVFRSPSFKLTGDFLTFTCAGWDGKGGGLGKNYFRLCQADTGTVLYHASPPQRDGLVEINVPVSQHAGKEVYFEAVDGLAATEFAWIALYQLGVTAKAVPGNKSAFHALKMKAAPGIWAISSQTGGGKPTTPYLTSKSQGEEATGTICSPPFILTEPSVVLHLRGHDTQAGGKGLNRVELVDSETGDVLRKAPAPQSDESTRVEWSTADLAGKSVVVRVTDDCGEGAYAWIGIDSVDAGADFSVDFSQGTSALTDWYTPGASDDYCDIDGVPFLLSSGSVISENGSVTIPLGFRVKRLFLAGLTNSIEQGFVWTPFQDRSRRFFLGDHLGGVEVVYADGQTDSYPLVLGDNMWFATSVIQCPEPFASFAEARAVRDTALNVYPYDPRSDHNYMTVLLTRDTAIESIRLFDGEEKAGAPIIRGVTVELEKGERTERTILLGHDVLSSEVKVFLREKGCYPEDSKKYDAESRVAQLRNVLYTTRENFPTSVAVSTPDGYRGPVVRFEGTPEAEILGNVYHHNLYDMDNKVGDNGRYHTSTHQAPSWGGYNGIGTWHPNWNSYYEQIWARDMGRALMELIEVGILDKARACADYSIMMGRVWEIGPQPEMEIKNIGRPLTLDGQPVPFHWDRRLNYPDTSKGEWGDNDSHGLTMLFFYNLWKRLPDREDWLRERWEWIEKGGDWIGWQFENPELSGATEFHIHTDSESSGGPGFSIYPDYCCMEGLRGFAEMAESIGKTEKASEWRAFADRLRKGMAMDYPEQDEEYGTVWTLKHAGWPHHTTVLAPVILSPDRSGYLQRYMDAEFLPITKASFNRVVDQTQRITPRGAYGSAMGYSQGFLTQSALLLDEMGDAEKMLHWTSRLTYYHVPDNEAWCYIVPEGAEIHHSGNFWFRTGDLGNGVQQAETVKSVRIVLGIDNREEQRLGLFPRLPQHWTTASVSRYPVWFEKAGARHREQLAYTLERTKDGADLDVEFSAVYPYEVDIRLGSFKKLGDDLRVTVDGSPVGFTTSASGDSAWISLTVQEGGEGFRVEVHGAS